MVKNTNNKHNVLAETAQIPDTKLHLAHWTAEMGRNNFDLLRTISQFWSEFRNYQMDSRDHNGSRPQPTILAHAVQH